MPSAIEWLNGGETWNFMDAINIETGKVGHFCVKIAPECKFCYAEKMNVNTYFGNGIRYAVDQFGKVRITLNERKMQKPLHWKKPRLVFPCSMTDLFGDWVPDEWLDAAYDVMEKAHWHTFLVLTKRPGRRMEYLRKRYANRPPAKNIWEGTSCGLQETADEFIPLLLQTTAAVRWVSAEPLLGPILLDNGETSWFSCRHKIDYQPEDPPADFHCCTSFDECGQHFRGIDWVVAGGESGPKPRPMHPDWPRSLRDQCQAAGVPFFFKQWGEFGPYGHSRKTSRGDLMIGQSGATLSFPFTGDKVHESMVRMYRVGKKAAGRLLDGKEHSEYPARGVGQ